MVKVLRMFVFAAGFIMIAFAIRFFKDEIMLYKNGVKNEATLILMKPYNHVDINEVRNKVYYVGIEPILEVNNEDKKVIIEYDGLYDSVGNKADDVNDRTMLYLTMRYNRRIIQNAAACKEDIESGKKLDRIQRANYRWMLIQPFMAIDDYSTSALTKEQKKELLEISKYIPSLLSKLDLQKQSKEEEDKFTEVLSQYFF